MTSLNELQRREFLSQMARQCLGVSIGAAAANMFAASPARTSTTNLKTGGGKAKSVIYLFMSGGMSHLDTLDHKPNAPEEIRGPVNAIATNVSGIQLGHCLPQLARQTDKIAIIRSMTSTQGAHKQGRYLMRTGYLPSNIIAHPSAGGWVNRHTAEDGSTGSLPRFVTVGCGNQHPRAGFMPPQFDPLPVGKPSAGIPDIRPSDKVTQEQFDQQLKIRELLDNELQTRFTSGYKSVRAQDTMFADAVKLMNSEDLKAFDINQESADTQRRYGTSGFAQGVLLARRLVEHGVRFIEVELGGFDWHGSNFESMESKMPAVDHILSTLIQDLDSRGLLDSTLVVLGTEFGRSPRINQNSGRDHFPKAFSLLMAGGGVKGGTIHGSTNATGSDVNEGHVDASSINATIGHAMGLPYDAIVYSSNRRPFQMNAVEGKPITELFG